MTLPSQIQALQIVNPGPKGRLEPVDLPMPEPGPGEVLIAVNAIGINRADLLQRENRYPLPKHGPAIPGLEVAGEIAAIGEGVTGVTPGDAVMAITGGGAYASHVVTPAVGCMPIPGQLSPVEAAALPEALFTVWMALMDKGQLQQGERVLIYGGSSGVGSIAIQMAVQLGARVTATASTAEKAALITKLGAHAVHYPSTPVAEAVKGWSDGEGVDVIFDVVGGDQMQDNLAMAAGGGRIVSIGMLEGGKAELKFGPILTRQLTWTGALLNGQTLARKAEYAAGLTQYIIPAVEGGVISPVIDSTYPLKKADDALEKMRKMAHIGKIVLEVHAKDG